MAKKVAVLAVNPVNGCGLFQYLEAFFENGISYKVFAVSDTKDIKTNSGISLTVDDVIANLKGHEDEFDALVFSCGDAVPVFQQNADKPYNVDLMQVIKTFGDKGKMMIGHCAGAMMFDFTGITKGKKVAVHPLAKPAIQNGTATDEKSEIDGNFFTAQDENTRATNDLASAIKASREGYKQKDNLQMLTIQEIRWLVQMLGVYTDKLNNRENRGTHLTINMDGKKFLEEYLGERDSEINVAAGVN